MYQSQGIYLVLVGMEVWTDNNKFTVSSDSLVTINGFASYRANKISTVTPNDHAVFIT